MFLLDLSEAYDLSVFLILKTFTTWINTLYDELPLYFPFPSQKLARRYLLKSFEKFPTTRMIIDGSEIFVEKASLVRNRHQHGLIINSITLGKHLLVILLTVL